MATATLTFDLDDEGDEMGHLCAVHGRDFFRALEEISDYARRILIDENEPIEEMDREFIVRGFKEMAMKAMEKVHPD